VTDEISSACQRAQLLSAVGRYDEAINELQLASARAPESFELEVTKAQTLHRARRYREALSSAERAIKFGPDEYRAHVARGDAALALGWTRIALSAAREASRLVPDAAWPHYIAARALRGEGRFEDARREADLVLRLEPDRSIGYDAHGWIALGQKHWTEAENAYRRALSIEPDNSGYQNNLGVALLNLGRELEATECFTAAGRDPRRTNAISNTAIAAQRHVNRPGMVRTALRLSWIASCAIFGYMLGRDEWIATALLSLVVIGGLCWFNVADRLRQRDLPDAARRVLRIDPERSSSRQTLRRSASMLVLGLIAGYFGFVQGRDPNAFKSSQGSSSAGIVTQEGGVPTDSRPAGVLHSATG
jgi:tetratricopeptide (TPR) repeat protein